MIFFGSVERTGANSDLVGSPLRGPTFAPYEQGHWLVAPFLNAKPGCLADPVGLLFAGCAERLTENELSDFSQLWHDDCGETIIGAQDVDRNHSPEV
jgi:hypothetical protein